MRNGIVGLIIIIFLTSSSILAQNQESPLKIFGYFQNSFQHWTKFEDRPEANSFSVQQLNIFFQKDLAQNWTAFIDLEFLNNFSSTRKWGAANLEEAWVRWRMNEKFNLKLGLQIPQFNNLNEIKNRTPLLPYIIRPLVYETSFNEFIPVEWFTPHRAFAQVYGFLPTRDIKLDYAVFLGNSLNINNDQTRGQTGIDTTTTMLVGGRFGVRYKELKLGISGTFERSNSFTNLAQILNIPFDDLHDLPMYRIGADLSYHISNLSFESEYINVELEEDLDELDMGLNFYYFTVGYDLTEKLFAYGSFWFMEIQVDKFYGDARDREHEDIITPNIGITFNINDRIRLKGHYARVMANEKHNWGNQDAVSREKDDFSVSALAVSIFF
jgi:hypothetical protein